MKKMMMASLFVCSLAAAGCGDDDDAGDDVDAQVVLSHSAPIPINIKVESGDVKTNNAISNEKKITDETGNPWGGFITAARGAIGGNDPSDINLTSLNMLLAATSTGVTAIEEVFVGDVVVQFVMDTSNNVVPVATISNPTGRGPLPMTVQFDYAMVTPQDRPRFLAGQFRIVMAGAAPATFQPKGAKADFQLTFNFTALQ